MTARGLHLVALGARKAGQWLRLMRARAARGELGRAKAMAMSLDLADNPHVARLTGTKPVAFSWLLPKKADLYIGWGRRASGIKAVQMAERFGGSYRLIEDGYIRSVDRYGPALAFAMDDQGVHFDASVPNRLEDCIKRPLSAEEEARATALIQKWRDARVSKYNAARPCTADLPERYVLLVDQVRDDKSISYGLADETSFTKLLERALTEQACDVVVKVHPDAAASAKHRHFDLDALRAMPRVHVIAEACHPVSLIENAEAVYAVTSQMGFEALLWGKPVHVGGMPFYAGWGLTEDAQPAPARRHPVSLAQLVHAALIEYPSFVDPVSGGPGSVEAVIDHISLQRMSRFEFPERLVAIGFSPWKRGILRHFLTGSRINFYRNAQAAQAEIAAGAPLILWGREPLPEGLEPRQIIRVEDGFLRSSGLGAELVRPMSLVFDDEGIYFDATGPSRLETLLENSDLTDEEKARAAKLRSRILDLELTKYNVGSDTWTRPTTDKKVVLVAGQVETDASIQFGSPEVRSNLDLLKRVRAECPEAYVIYKPHPDVVAGLRATGSGENEAVQYCDELLTDSVSVGGLLSGVDVVHTMTSLMGFEAILRDVPVVCHGLPFYAGWGLTTDRQRCPRRTRRLSVEELVHGSLISYPRYYSYEQVNFMTPEAALDELVLLRERARSGNRFARSLVRGVRVAFLNVTGSKK